MLRSHDVYGQARYHKFLALSKLRFCGKHLQRELSALASPTSLSFRLKLKSIHTALFTTASDRNDVSSARRRLELSQALTGCAHALRARRNVAELESEHTRRQAAPRQDAPKCPARHKKPRAADRGATKAPKALAAALLFLRPSTPKAGTTRSLEECGACGSAPGLPGPNQLALNRHINEQRDLNLRMAE